MKKLFFFLSLMFSFYAYSQDCPDYSNLIKEGDNFIVKKDFRRALNKYNAAKLCSPAKSTEVDKKINFLFEAIENEKNEAVKQKKETETAKELADNRLSQLSDLISNITDLIQDKKADAIIGFSPLKADLLDVLIPASESIASTSKSLAKSWRNAEIHFQKGNSFQDLGNSYGSEKEYALAYTESYELIETILKKKGTIPDELAYIYLRSLLFYTWNLITEGETKKVIEIFNSSQNILDKIDIHSASLYHAIAGFMNAKNRFYSEVIKKDSIAFISIKEAVRYSRKAVSLDSSIIRYQVSLATHIDNLCLEKNFLSTTEITKLQNEACNIFSKINSSSGNGGFAMYGMVGCVINESFDLVKDTLYSVAINNLLNIASQLSTLSFYDPSNKDLYISRARIYTRLAQIEVWNMLNKENAKLYINKAVDDWANGISSTTNIENLWAIKSSYENISFIITTCYSNDTIFLVQNKLLKAFDLNQKTYGNIPSIAKMTAMNYSKAAELYPKKSKQDTMMVLAYCKKSEEAFRRLNIEKDLGEYDENYATYCKPYNDEISIYILQGNVEEAKKSYAELFNLAYPLYQKYQFDFYMGQYFTGSSMRMGKFLFDKGYISESLPILKYASYNGIGESSKILATMYRQGLTVSKNIKVADSLDDLGKKQTMKRFTIPCDFGGKKSDFDIYVRQLPKDYPYKAIEDQAEWLLKARGGKVPDEVRSAFIKLQEIAWKENVSFPELCVYALEETNKKKDTTSNSVANLKIQNKKENEDTVEFKENKTNIKYLTKTNNIEKLKTFLKLYLDDNDTTNAKFVRNKILKINDSIRIKEEIYNIYLLKTGNGQFESLYLNNPNKIKEYRTYFLSKNVSTIPTNAFKRVHFYNLIDLDEAYLKNKPSDSSKVKLQLANHYNSLGWYCLLTAKYNNVIYYFTKSLQYDSAYVYPLENLAHAYLFTNQFERAKKLYLQLKDMPFDKEAGYPLFRDAFLSDFKEFDENGLMNDDIKEIRRLLSQN